MCIVEYSNSVAFVQTRLVFTQDVARSFIWNMHLKCR